MLDYAYGYCGMPCALCTRYRTSGKSKCPGCSHNGYYTDSCKVHHCCQEKGLKHCGMCAEFPCVRLDKMNDFSDLDTNNVMKKTVQVSLYRASNFGIKNIQNVLPYLHQHWIAIITEE